MSRSNAGFRWRSIALPVLLPTLLFSIGEGAIIPIIPASAGDLGATLATAGLIAGLLTIGELAGNIPSGWLVARAGERPSMIGASALAIAGVLLCIAARDPLGLGVGIVFIGLATAVFSLARHAFVTTYVPYAYRARALSVLAGAFRAGLFIGPLMSAIAVTTTGSTAAAFVVQAAACLAAILALVLMRDPIDVVDLAGNAHPGPDRLDPRRPPRGAPVGLAETVRRNRTVLARLGTGVALLQALRASRTVVVPLWALGLGVAPADTAMLIAIAGAVDFGLFYAGGVVMDRFGRLWTALPAIGGLSIGHLALSATAGLPGGIAWFVGATILLAVANGIGSGIVMTIGADLANRYEPAPFLGAWRFIAGLGAAAAPMAIAGLTAVSSLSMAVGALGISGLVGAAVLARYVPRYTEGAWKGLRSS